MFGPIHRLSWQSSDCAVLDRDGPIHIRRTLGVCIANWLKSLFWFLFVSDKLMVPFENNIVRLHSVDGRSENVNSLRDDLDT